MDNPQAGAFFDLSPRAKYRFAGADRVRYLNGQVTNDVRKATPDTLLEACVLNAKGKLNGLVFIQAQEDAFLLDADEVLRETLGARLERYVIADDVQIADVTDELALFHVIAGMAPDLPGDYTMVAANRYGCAGWDLRSDTAERKRIAQHLSSLFSCCDEECVETFRIERGIPRWGHELTEEIIPVEANLEAATIDYGKGCYIGQETISRMKMSGQANKRLVGLVSVSDKSLRPKMRLGTADEGKDVGWITSAAESRRLGKQIALAFVKRGSNSIGTRLRAHEESADNPAAVEIVPLPFV